MKLSKALITRTVCMLLLITACTLMFISPGVFAGTTTPEATLPLSDILRLFMAPEVALKWGSLIGATCYFFTQILPWIPPHYLEKLHPKVNGFIQRIAGNYRGTKNVLSQPSNQALK